MKVNIRKEIRRDSGQSIIFDFELENDDVRESTSTNAGRAPIKLGANRASFHFPLEFDLPHPDLCTLAALKIISPYIGRRLVMERPCSPAMAQAITEMYPGIREVISDPGVRPRSKPAKEQPAVSFSGGADSVAAASILPEGTPLLLSAREWHPMIGKFEAWYNTDANIQTVRHMPDRFRKFVVKSDFEFLSTNGSYCIYPDSYSFTIPCILLADELSLSHIVTGDIWVAFTGDETKYRDNLFSTHGKIFEAVGLQLEPVLNGIGEIGSLLIANAYDVLDYATTCQYGAFQKPCMRCIKCFRKSVYAWAIFGKALTPDQLAIFNQAPAVKKFADEKSRKRWAFAPTYKHCFLRIDQRLEGAVGSIRKRALSENVPYKFVDKIYQPAYTQRERPTFVDQSAEKMRQVMEVMSEDDVKEFRNLNFESYRV